MRFVRNLLILAFVGFGAVAAFAHEYKAGDIEIVHPWTRVPLKGSDVTGGYMTIVNHGGTPDRLLSITVEFSKSAQIHEMKMEGDVMKMAEMKDGLEIPAGATVEFKPKSYHLMFMGVTQELIADEMVEGELTFEKAGKVKVEFMVEPADASHSMDNM